MAYWLFGIFCCLFVLLLVSVEMSNHKFWTNDFVVYHGATTDFFQGNDPYDHSYGLSTGFFKYIPTTLYLFLPLTWLNFETAQLLHTISLTVSLILATWMLHAIFFAGREGKKLYGIMYGGFAFIAIYLTREFHMGNINLHLLFLFCAGLYALHCGKQIATALFWGMMIALKPIVILVVLPLIIYRKWRIVLAMFIMGLFLAILPITHLGFRGGVELWERWFNAISAHGDYILSQNSIKYLFKRYTGSHSEWGASFLVLFTLIATMIWAQAKKKRINLIDWVVIFLAFCPNFFVTDTEHFLLSLPIFMLLIVELIRKRKLGWWLAFAMACLFFSFNSNDLLGKGLNGTLSALGLPGIANMLFVLLLILLKARDQIQPGEKNNPGHQIPGLT